MKSASTLPQTPRHYWPPGSIFRGVPKQSCCLMEMVNLLQQNQTSTEQPDPPDSLVNPGAYSNRKHFPLQKNFKIRNTLVSDERARVKTLMRSFGSFFSSSHSCAAPHPSPHLAFLMLLVEASVEGEVCCQSGRKLLKWGDMELQTELQNIHELFAWAFRQSTSHRSDANLLKYNHTHWYNCSFIHNHRKHICGNNRL